MSDDRKKEIEQVWTPGPTHKMLDASRFEIIYRYRENEWDEWKIATIGSTARNEDDACKRTVGFLSKRRPNWTVQLIHCIDRGNEVDITTGQPTKLVSDNDFRALKEKVVAEMEEAERKEKEWLAKNVVSSK